MPDMEPTALNAPVGVGLVQAAPARPNQLPAVPFSLFPGGVPLFARTLAQIAGAHRFHAFMCAASVFFTAPARPSTTLATVMSADH